MILGRDSTLIAVKLPGWPDRLVSVAYHKVEGRRIDSGGNAAVS